MRLSTSTNLFAYRPGRESYIPIVESVRRCAAVGYEALDVNLCDATRSYYMLARDEWRSWVLELAATARACGIEFSQSHVPFYNVLDPGFAHRDEYEKMVRRAIEASGMLGVKWIAIHAGTCPGDNGSFSLSKERNREYLSPHVELAARFGCGIAIENLCDERCGWTSRLRRTYTAGYEELCELVDSFGSPDVGVCWDFGHANLMGFDQPTALRYIGRRLKATHVADNSGALDDHIVPFLGTIDWPAAMRALHQIEYGGDFTYEIHCATSRLPDDLLDAMGRYTVAVGKYLLSL